MKSLFSMLAKHMPRPWQRRKPGVARVPGQEFYALAAGLALMLMAGATMSAGIKDTKHNLGSTNTVPGGNKFSGTTEICVFCHTPHGANVSIPVPAPLWNRNFSTAPYTTYASLGTSSLDAQAASTGSVSLACLSCHDGTQAMDVMINTPGSGTDPAGFPATGTWSGDALAAGGTLATAGKFTYIGVDLSNDHPVSIQYGGGGITAVAPTAATNDPDFKAPNHSGAGAGTLWWIETNANTTRELTDLRLYTRTETSTYDGLPLTGDTQPFVECASCHDPHSSNTTFLRIPNDGSAVCLSCHSK